MTGNENVKIPTYMILILGDSSVGKSSVLKRFTEDTFMEIHLATIGFGESTKELEVNGHKVNAKIFDTAGQERYRSLGKSLYKKANGVMVLYDITDKSSFDGIKKWISSIREDAPQNILITLLGNKIDLKDKRVVDIEQGKKLSKDLELGFFETSAKTGENINEAFVELISKIDKNYSNNKKKSENISLDNKNQNKKKKCC